jgi:LPXTG-site transpeptidase (sortase) family protein
VASDDHENPSSNGAPPNGDGGFAPGEPWPTSGVGSRPMTAVRPEPAPKRVLGAAGFFLGASRRRRGFRIGAWALVVALAVGGLGLLFYPVITDIWAHRIQGGLEKKFQALSGEKGYGKTIAEGSPLTRIIIPKLGVDIIVVEGISGNALRAGAGHYPGTALPGAATGNIAIAGHRTGFGEPFRHMERLGPGDVVYLVTPFGKFAYKAVPPFGGHGNWWLTGATDWSVVQPTPTPVLTLTTCDPPHTSLHRMILRLSLVGKVKT